MYRVRNMKSCFIKEHIETITSPVCPNLLTFPSDINVFDQRLLHQDACLVSVWL